MTNRAVATTEVDKLSKLLRLALVADKDGEAVAAIGAVKRLLDSSGLDPHWVADTFERGATLVAVTPGSPERSERSDRSAAWYAFHRRYSLSPKENAFIKNIVERSAPLTPKQREWLHDIVDRLEGG